MMREETTFVNMMIQLSKTNSFMILMRWQNVKGKSPEPK